MRLLEFWRAQIPCFFDELDWSCQLAFARTSSTLSGSMHRLMMLVPAIGLKWQLASLNAKVLTWIMQ